MCGIAGILSLSNKKIFEKELKLMNETAKHRGPDAEGYFLEDNIGLAHRRLSIIDLNKNANQPFFYQDQFVLIFNGEIYNYIEIKEKLLSRGYKFQTESDSEVLLKAYVEWGCEVQNIFNGMWAFAIWDRVNKELFCSRDRFGIKPFYWALKSNNFYFGSEIKQLRSIGIGKKCNFNEISIYLFTGCTNSSKESFYEDIFSLEPGHSLFINKSGERIIKCWYKLTNKISEIKKDNDPDKLYDILNDAVKIRLRSDVKIGSALSGGIDSSSLVSMAIKNIDQNSSNGGFVAIHAKSTEPQFDESQFALDLAKNISCQLSLIEPKLSDFIENINEIIFFQDEPFASMNIFMQYFLMKKAKELKCKVMIDGQGSDEIFFGYSRLIFPFFYNVFKEHGILNFLMKTNAYIRNNYEINFKAFCKYFFGYPSANLRSRYIQRKMNYINLSIDPVYELYKKVSRTRDDVDAAQIMDIERITLPQILRTEDKNSMANSIEARIPFLDYRLVEYSLNLKYDSKIKDGWTKYPLRKLNVIDKKLAWRKSKFGYDAPRDQWSNKFSANMRERVINSDFIKSFTDKKISKYWSKISPNEKWRIFNLTVWQEIHKVDF